MSATHSTGATSFTNPQHRDSIMAAKASLVKSGIVAPEQALPMKALRPRLPGGWDHYFRTIPMLVTGGGFATEAAMTINRKFDTSSPIAC